MNIEREKCSVRMCGNVARKTIFGARYCSGCGAGVEQAAYAETLPADALERARYRREFAALPAGVDLPEPLAMPAGWRSRR